MKRCATIALLVFMLGCSSSSESGSQSDSDSSSSSVALRTATVVSYKSGVEWDHFDDGAFEVRDQLQLSIEPNADLVSVSLSPKALSKESPFRIAGTRFTFQSDLPISSETRLFWDALKSPTVVE